MDLIRTEQIVLVTGANGFLGTALVRELTASGATVHALGNRDQRSLAALLPPDRIHLGQKTAADITALIQQVNPSTIFHLASVFEEPDSPLELEAMLGCNLTLGTNLLFAASRQRTPPAIVNAGSYWQFGDTPDRLPNTLYAATKRSLHEILLYYRDKYNVPALTLVLYDMFGTNDPRPKLWSRLITAPEGAQIPLTPGNQTVHLVHVTDAVRAFLRAADLLHDQARVEALHSVHSLHPQSLKALVNELNDKAHLNLRLLWGNLPHAKDQIFEPWVGEYLPGWQPSVDALEALMEDASKHRAGMRIDGVAAR